MIIAPTSSGKTYAAYYAMESVLKESDDGVVVYIAPTKALVNQGKRGEPSKRLIISACSPSPPMTLTDN